MSLCLGTKPNWGWSGGAMVLGKLPVPGLPTSLEKSRARAFCTCRRCRWGCLDIFTLIYLSSFLSPSLWETTRYRLKYCLKGSLSPKTTNQPTKPNNGNFTVAIVTDLWCHLTYNSREAWHTVACSTLITVKILKFGTPQTIAIIVLKIEKFDVTLH